MSLEYKNRGILHKLNKVGTSHKNFILKTAVKTVLAAETTALFTKDIITNRFVGKEFHVKLERYQSKSGKFKTHVKLIRVKKTKDSPKGMLHKILSLDKKVEGDKPHSKKRFKLVRAALLTSESATIAAGSIGIEELRRKLKNSSSVNDGGKATISVLTAAADLNKARKYIVSYKTNRRIYKNLVKHYKQGKKSYKESKKKYKQPYRKIETAKLHPTIYNNLTSFKKFKYQIWGTVNDIGAKNRYKKEKVTVLQAKKKGYKVMRKAVKEHKRETGYVSLGMLPTLPAKYISKKLIESYSQKIVSEASDNDFIQAIDKGYRISKAVKEFDKKVVKPVNEKLKEKYFEHMSSKLHLKENRLREKKIKPKRKKKINSSQKKLSEKSKEAAKKAAKATSKVVADFAKFALKLLGIVLIPVIGIILTVSIILLILTGGTGNSSYILGTYNAEDRYISYAVEHYTKIAYDFNEKILRCGTDDWKNALNDLGVDTSEFTEDPNNFYFGRSRYFSGTPSYDFDFDKLAAFMCAYYYEYDDEGNIQNWEWNNDYDEVLQQLFDTEYEFKSYYENRSYWKQLNSYIFYAGGGSGESYWTVYEEGFSKNRMKIRYIPEEIKVFCKDGYLHYDYNTLEVLDANNDDKKTGYFIQDQRYIVRDPSGVVNYPFYSTKDVEYSEVNRFYREGRVYYNSYGTRGAVVDFNDHETLYWIHDINSSPLQYYKFVWKNGVDGRGIPIFEDRTGYYWTSDYKQIYCVVNPTDTHKWNNELEDICLVNFYKKNEWVTVCNLYYTVEKKCSFETAIEKVLKSKDEDPNIQAGRIEFYKILTQENENGRRTYGNHQMFPSPVSKSLQELIDDNEIYHGYGYDIQEWNTKHCEGLNDNHMGMDIITSKGTEVYAMFDGYVNWINEENNTISIKSSESSNYWYDDNRNTEVIFSNIKATVTQGDNVVEGQLIGKVTDYKHCFDNWDIQASKNYLHIEIKIEYPKDFPGIGYEFIGVDPRFLIYRDNPEEE